MLLVHDVGSIPVGGHVIQIKTRAWGGVSIKARNVNERASWVSKCDGKS